MTCTAVQPGCFKAGAAAACPADQTCTTGVGCTCTDTASATLCANAQADGTVCAANLGSVITCTAGTTDATGTKCFTTAPGATCTSPEFCQTPSGSAICACPPPVDASMATGTNTLGCALLGQLTCGTDSNVDQCVVDPTGATQCQVWAIQGGVGGEGDCVGGGSSDPVTGNLLCLPDALQCQCPANGSSSNFYANTLPEVAAVRKPFLTQNGRRIPAVCSFESLTLAVHAAKTNSGPGHSPFARAIMSRIGATFAFEPVVFDQENWSSSIDDTGTRPMEISDRIRLTTERDPDLGIPSPDQPVDTPRPETVDVIGQINPTLYILVENGFTTLGAPVDPDGTLYFSGTTVRVTGSLDVGGKGRGFTIVQGTDANNGDAVRPLVVFDGYGIDNITPASDDFVATTLDQQREPRLDRVVIEGGGGPVIGTPHGTFAAPQATTFKVADDGTVTFTVTTDAEAKAAFIGFVNAVDGTFTALYQVIGVNGRTLTLYAPGISALGADLTVSGIWSALAQGDKNVGLFVGTTAGLPFNGGAGVNGISGHPATGGAFDSVIINNFPRLDHWAVGALIHRTYADRTGRLSATFIGPIEFNNYQAMQVDGGSLVHLPLAPNKLLANATLGEPSFLPAFNSYLTSATRQAGGATTPPGGVMAHNGVAGLILPRDFNTNELMTDVDAHGLLITDTFNSPDDGLADDNSLVGDQLELDRQGVGVDNAQANATVELFNSIVENSVTTGALVENGHGAQPQAYNTIIDDSAASGRAAGNVGTLPCTNTFITPAVDCTKTSPYGVLSLHVSHSTIGSTTNLVTDPDTFGNNNGIQVVEPGGHVLVDGQSSVDHNNEMDLATLCGPDPDSCTGHRGFGILIDTNWPSDVDVRGSSVSNNELAGIQVDNEDTAWSAALMVEQDGGTLGGRDGTASNVNFNGLQGVNAIANSAVSLSDSNFNDNGQLNDCSAVALERHEYGIAIMGTSIMWARSIDVERNLGGGIYLNTECTGGASIIGVKCTQVLTDQDVWTNSDGSGGPNRISGSTINSNGAGNTCNDLDEGGYRIKHADGVEVTRRGWLQFVNAASTVDSNVWNGIRVEGLMDLSTDTQTIPGTPNAGQLAPAGITVTNSGKSGLRIDDDGWASTTLSSFGISGNGNKQHGAFVMGHLESTTDQFSFNAINGITVNETTEDTEDNVGATADAAANRGALADFSFSPRFFSTTIVHGRIQGNTADGMEVVSAPGFADETATGGACAGTPLTDDACFVSDWAVIVKEGAALQSQTEMFGNGNVGFQAGGDNQQHDVWAKVENTHLFQNAVGFVGDGHFGINADGSQKVTTAVASKKTAVTVFANNIEENTSAAPLTATGMYIHQAFIAFETVGVGINGNVIGNNGWGGSDTMCTFDNEVASQTEFEGHVPLLGTSADDACTDAHTDTQETDCNNDRARHCIFNENAAANKCRRAYDMSTKSCNDTNANQISGYDRLGTENEDIKVGIVAKDSAWVNAENASFLTTAFQVDLDWTPITSDSFASNAGTQCPAAAKKCPTPPLAIFP